MYVQSLFSRHFKFSDLVILLFRKREFTFAKKQMINWRLLTMLSCVRRANVTWRRSPNWFISRSSQTQKKRRTWRSCDRNWRNVSLFSYGLSGCIVSSTCVTSSHHVTTCETLINALTTCSLLNKQNCTQFRTRSKTSKNSLIVRYSESHAQTAHLYHPVVWYKCRSLRAWFIIPYCLTLVSKQSRFSWYSYHLALFAVRISRYLLWCVHSDAELRQEVVGKLVAVDQFELSRVDGQFIADVEVLHGVELSFIGTRTRHSVTTDYRACAFTQNTLHYRQNDISSQFLFSTSNLELTPPVPAIQLNSWQDKYQTSR